jgi:hypothetical protein
MVRVEELALRRDDDAPGALLEQWPLGRQLVTFEDEVFDLVGHRPRRIDRPRA